MKHFFLSGDVLGAKEIIFTNQDFHYLKNVLRLKKGSTLTGVDSKGNTYNLKITQELQGKLVAAYSLKKKAEPENAQEENVIIEKSGKEPGRNSCKEAFELTLYQGILKGNKFDTLIRQTTEAGITRIVPLVSAYTIVKIREQEENQKSGRWKRIAREAVQQSGRISMPEITCPKTLHECKDLGGLKLFFHQEPVSGKTLHYYLASCPEKIHIFIGPEGGFSKEEIHWLLDAGFSPVYMGATVLRAETAAIFAIAAIKMILLEKNEWRLL